MKIIAIGNPGGGKSTVLNSLAGRHLFESGISFGQGLTDGLLWKQMGSNWFADTPGLADEVKQKRAAQEIRQGLIDGGAYKIIFFTRQIDGRCVAEDSTTIKLVLDSCPNMVSNYAIVVNKIPEEIAQIFRSRPSCLDQYLEGLFGPNGDGGIFPRCDKSNVFFMMEDRRLLHKNNAVVESTSLKDIYGKEFKKFVFKDMPTANIARHNAKIADILRFKTILRDYTKIINGNTWRIIEYR